MIKLFDYFHFFGDWSMNKSNEIVFNLVMNKFKDYRIVKLKASMFAMHTFSMFEICF